jgi:hypothetical protein
MSQRDDVENLMSFNQLKSKLSKKIFKNSVRTAKKTQHYSNAKSSG